jgi:hypothetical protein
MNRLFLSVLLTILLCALSATAQVNPNNVPKPPVAELKKFEPFLGKYNVTADYAKLKWSGTLEIKPAIKGWYIERTILIKTDDGKIDREFRSLITFDTSLKSYRVWGFETLPPKNNERSGRFEGNEFIEELEIKRRDGSKSTLRSRYMMPDKDEVRIVTEDQDAAGKITPVGVTVGKRVK